MRSGETLGEIAQHYYPGRVQSGIRLIVEANQISNPNRIRENDKLVIPASNVRRPGARPSVGGTNREPAPTTGRRRSSRSLVRISQGIESTTRSAAGSTDAPARARASSGSWR